jgi:hypothetical protein
MLAKWGRPARFLRYEDIMRDAEITRRQFADALRVDLEPIEAGSCAGPPHEKIADSWNQEVEERFRREDPDFVTKVEGQRLIRRQPGEPGWLALTPACGPDAPHAGSMSREGARANL